MGTREIVRDIDLEVAYNVRHIGGYDGSSGRVTSSTLIRAASLHRLTAFAVGDLRDRGVTTVVDLRSSTELEQSPSPDMAFAGIRVVHAPVFEQDASPVGMDEDFPGYARVYERLLERGPRAYRALFEVIADADGCVLFHCAAGKDRTGVAAALLLAVAGVATDEILSDYSRSAELLAPQMPEWTDAMRARGIDDSRIASLMASNPEDMADTLTFISDRWGSAEGYLTEAGVSASAIAEVRARLLA